MNETNRNKTAVALGFFDGLHIAHRAVLQNALEQKTQGLIPTVLLFDRHPYEALTGNPVPRLMTDADREKTLRAMGFQIRSLSFAAVRDLSPAAFVRLLKEEYACGFVSCGYNYTFGAGGRGSAADLKALCAEQGIAAQICGRICLNGRDVCSSAIRAAVKGGDLQTAVAMLGAPLTFASPVVSGDHRGVSLGAPTANQALPAGFIVPAFGVYASFAQVDGARFPAVTNIGSRPTFNGQDVRSETHLLGFSGDLYGKDLRVGLLEFLRAERRFPSFDALKTQIAADADAANAVVRQHPLFSAPWVL